MDDIKINVSGLKIKGDPLAGSSALPKKQEEAIKQLSAKLHPEYDQDLIEHIKKIPKRERSKLYRDALRFFLESGMK